MRAFRACRRAGLALAVANVQPGARAVAFLGLVAATCISATPASAGAATTTTTTSPKTHPPPTTLSPDRAPVSAVPPPPIESLLPSGDLSSLPQVPAGGANGPLTASYFANLSTSSPQGAAQFERWSQEAGFAAWVRTWKDFDANHTIQIELFQFPNVAEASDFDRADEETFTQVSTGQSLLGTYKVPSVADSIGISVQIDLGSTTGLVQGVLLRVNGYVAIVNSVAIPSPSVGSPGTVPEGTVSAVAASEAARLYSIPSVPAMPASLHPSRGTSSTVSGSGGIRPQRNVSSRRSGAGGSFPVAVLLIPAVALAAAFGSRRRRRRSAQVPQSAQMPVLSGRYRRPGP